MKYLIPADIRRMFRIATPWLKDVGHGRRSPFVKPAAIKTIQRFGSAEPLNLGTSFYSKSSQQVNIG